MLFEQCVEELKLLLLGTGGKAVPEVRPAEQPGLGGQHFHPEPGQPLRGEGGGSLQSAYPTPIVLNNFLTKST